MKKRALGKGLDSLIPKAPRQPPKITLSDAEPATATAAPDAGLHQIDLDLIRPNARQPRQDFDEAALEALAGSLKSQGVIQPVIVRPVGDGRYELVAGERRWRAAQQAGLMKIPALIRSETPDRALELALIENVQREDLNPIEEAEAYRTLIQEMGLTQAEVAERVGKQRSTISNMIRLLGLPRAVQKLVRTGDLSMGHARAVAGLESHALQTRLAEQAVQRGASVRQLETWVSQQVRSKPAEPKAAPPRDPNIAAAEDGLQRAVGTKVRIIQGKEGGRIELHFHNTEEMNRVYDLLIQASRQPADV